MYDRLRDTGGRLRQALTRACESEGFAVQSVGEDAVFDVYFADHAVQNYRDGLAADAATLGKLNAGLLQQRIIKSWPQKFYPSIVHTDVDVDETIAAIQAVAPTLRG